MLPLHVCHAMYDFTQNKHTFDLFHNICPVQTDYQWKLLCHHTSGEVLTISDGRLTLNKQSERHQDSEEKH